MPHYRCLHHTRVCTPNPVFPYAASLCAVALYVGMCALVLHVGVLRLCAVVLHVVVLYVGVL